MTNGFRNIATRIAQAETRFIEYAQSKGLTLAEAEAALRFMRRGGKRAPLQIDSVGGTFTFSHGAFAEADVLRRAAQLGAGFAMPSARTARRK